MRDQHAELLADIELVAERANAGRHKRQDAAGILEAAEVALVRVQDAWRRSRGGRQNNLFFTPLSRRLRRICAHYRDTIHKAEPARPPADERWVYRIIDYEQIPFHRLRPYFRASAVDEAIKTGIILGLRDLPGVRIYREEPSDE